MPDYPFTIFSGIAFLLCIPPAYFNWKIPNRPWASLLFISWMMMINLVYFMDSIIWCSDDMSTWWDGKIYCDIDFRIKDMFDIGVPGAAIGICRFLADATNPNPSRSDPRNDQFIRNMIDLFLSIILPLMVKAVTFLFETSRYHIVGVEGCASSIDVSRP